MRIPALLLLTSAVMAGCATQAPPARDARLSAHFSPPAAGAVVLVMPPLTRQPYPKGDALLRAQVRTQLTGLGYHVVEVDEADAHRRWKQEIDAVGGIYDPATGAMKHEAYQQAISRLTTQVCASAGCALVVNPRILVRTARLGGSHASWDGQRRRMPESDAGDVRYSGTTQALSVAVEAFLPDSSLAFKTFGGASLPFERTTQGGRRLRADLFDSDGEIAQGVSLALAPLIGS